MVSLHAHLGKCAVTVFPSRFLKQLHSPAPPEQCMRVKTLVVFRGAISAM
jgi:hypothetical protein